MPHKQPVGSDCLKPFGDKRYSDRALSVRNGRYLAWTRIQSDI